MMEQLKNSGFSRVLQVLLIGYFLISSLNLSQSLNKISSHEADVHKKESIVWHIFKKMLKCNVGAEEYEDCDNEPNNSNNNIKLVVDYILPVQMGIIAYSSYKVSPKKIYFSHSDLTGILHSKIHVPPPEVIL